MTQTGINPGPEQPKKRQHSHRLPLSQRHFGHLWDHPHIQKPQTSSGRLAEFRTISHLIWPYRKIAFWVWSGTCFRSMLMILLPVLSKYAIDDGIQAGNAEVLVWLCIASAIIIVVAAVGDAVRWDYGYMLADRVTTSLQSQVFAHMQTLSKRQLEEIGAGTLISRVSNDAPAIRILLQQGLLHVISNGVTVVASLTFMVLMDWQLTLLTLVTVPALLLATWLYKRAARPGYIKSRKTLAQVTASAHDSFSLMRLVHSYGQEDKQKTEFNRANLANRESQLGPNVYTAFFDPASSFITATAVGVLIIYGGLQAASGAIQVGTIVAFVGLTVAFFAGIIGLSGIVSTYQSGIAALDQVFDFLAIETELDEPEHPIAVPPGQQNFRFEGVNFTDKNLTDSDLEDLTFEIAAAGRTALVGEIGSGRSTICQLLARMSTPGAGQITYGGIDIHDLNIREYHERVRYVAAEPYIFAGSLRESLRGGNPSATDEQLIGALGVVGGPGFLNSFPNGLDAQITAGGRNLSSGQISLVGLARAILVLPEVLIIDGTLDRLDPRVPTEFSDRLRAFGRIRTLIVATERKDIAREARDVFMLEHGRLVERGTFDDLNEAGGPFANL